MPDGHEESVAKPAPSQGFIHDICDDFERDRQANSSVALLPYIERAPEALRNWILKELLAIELDVRQAAGQPVDREALLSYSGMPAESFDEAWSQLHDAAKTRAITDTVTKLEDGKLEDGKSTIHFHRGTKAVTDSLEFATYVSSSDKTISDAGPRAKKLPLVADDFEIIDMLGEGGMGVVYRAYQHSLQRQVALKIIPQRYMNLPQVLARFFIEVEATASMNHPGIVPVYEFGERNGVHFYAMALVEGGNLSKYVGTAARPPKKRMEPKQVAEIIHQVSEAVQYAHDHAVIHRDIKPANILVDETGHPMLADFGLAKILDKEEESLTMTGNVLGTPAYMAPEQASGKKVGISNRTDVYALGATMYGLLTGCRPFEGETQYEVIQKVVQTSPAPINTLVPTLPLDLRTICEKCLAKRPQERYDSARELGEDLQLYLDGYPISARPLGPIRRCVSWCRRNPVVAFWGAVVGMVLLSAAIVSNVYRLRAEESAEDVIERSLQVKRVLNDTFGAVMAPEFDNDPNLQPLIKAILSKGKSYYQDLITQLRDDASLVSENGNAQFSLGKILGSLAQDKQATQALHIAQENFESLVDSGAETPEDRNSLAATHVELGRLGKREWDAQVNKQGNEAQSALQAWRHGSQSALKLREQAIENAADPVESRRLLASSQENMAMVHAENGLSKRDVNEIARAIRMLEDAQSTRREAIKIATDDSRLTTDLARGHGNSARMEWEQYKIYSSLESDEQAEKHLLKSEEAAKQAISTYQKVKTRLSGNNLARSDLAYCLQLRALASIKLQRYQVAEQSYAQAAKVLELVYLQSPQTDGFRKSYSRAQLQLATFYVSNRYQEEDALYAWKIYLSIYMNELKVRPSNTQAEESLEGGISTFWKLLGSPTIKYKKQLKYKFLRATANELNRLFEDTEGDVYRLLKVKMKQMTPVLEFLEKQFGKNSSAEPT